MLALDDRAEQHVGGKAPIARCRRRQRGGKAAGPGERLKRIASARQRVLPFEQGAVERLDRAHRLGQGRDGHALRKEMSLHVPHRGDQAGKQRAKRTLDCKRLAQDEEILQDELRLPRKHRGGPAHASIALLKRGQAVELETLRELAIQLARKIHRDPVRRRQRHAVRSARLASHQPFEQRRAT